MPGKFKDESASKCITEFVGLRSKMYSFMLDDKKDVSKAEVRVDKGVQKSVIFNDLRFSTYLNCLWNDEVKEHNFKTIRGMKHSMATYTQSKIMLCTVCHKPYPNLKFYEKHSKRCNSCQSRYVVAKTKKASMENNRRKFGDTTGK